MITKQQNWLKDSYCTAACICVLILMAVNVSGQTPSTGTLTTAKTLVKVTVAADGPRSELPFIPIGGPVGAINAEFSAMYFGPQKDFDLSFLVLAKFQSPRYGGKRTFAIKFLIDNVQLSNNLRMVNRVAADEIGESLQFSVTVDEIAWLALGEKLEIVVYDADSNQKLDTYRFTAGGLQELKSFAKSVLILKNYEN